MTSRWLRRDFDASSIGPLAIIVGTAGIDSLQGGGGDDEISAYAGNDTVRGGGGDDWLQPGSGHDSVIGGAGFDTVSYEGDADDAPSVRGVIVNLVSGTAADAWNSTDVLVGVEAVFGSSMHDRLVGNGQANDLYGNAGNDTLVGGSGDDWLQPGPGNDAVYGGGGADLLSYQADESDAPAMRGIDVDLVRGTAVDSWGSTDTLLGIEGVFGSSLNDLVVGSSQANDLTGSDGDDTLIGGAGADWLQPGAGTDTVDGGVGEDTVSYQPDESDAPATHGVNADLSVGTATDSWGQTDTLVSIEIVVGSSLNDTLAGANQGDLVEGGAGHDTLLYAQIVYESDPAGVFVNLSSSSKTFHQQTVGARLAVDGYGDTDILGRGVISGYGSAFDDIWFGSEQSAGVFLRAGNDYVRLGSGDDWLQPGSGNDTVNAGAGSDGVSYEDDEFDSAGAAFQGVHVDLRAGTAIDGWNGTDTLIGIEDVYGSSLDDSLTGNAAQNYLEGGAGNDTLVGGAGNDYLLGGTGNDVVDGGAGQDFFAVAGSTLDDYRIVSRPDGSIEVTDINLSDGDEGSDTLIGVELLGLAIFGTPDDDIIVSDGSDPILALGNTGDDVYVLRYAADQVVERPGQGVDTVEVGISRALEPNVENLVLTGRANVDATGNSADNQLTGNVGNNVLDGATGADTLRGGDGNDVYYVDDAGDAVDESGFPGTTHNGAGHPWPLDLGSSIDTVISQINYTLTENVEILQQAAAAGDLQGTGNVLPNILNGNEGNNTLSGLAGNDTLNGALGNDTLNGGLGADSMSGGDGNDNYVVNVAGDVIIENSGGGNDSVSASVSKTLAANVENLTLSGAGNINGTGNALANTITGNGGNNTLNGSAGADTLSGLAGNDGLGGGAGNDALTGGAGTDGFLFSAALSAATNVDTVVDFAPSSDTLRLDDDIFTEFDAAISTTLAASQFAAGDGFSAGQDADDRIVYDTASGALYYDADGNGDITAIQFATLGTSIHPTLTASDFVIVA